MTMHSPYARFPRSPRRALVAALVAALAALASLALGCQEKQGAQLPPSPAPATASSSAAGAGPAGATRPGDPAAPATQPAVDPAGSPPGGEAPASTPTPTPSPTSYFTGTTEPHRRSTLTASIGGKITRVYVRDGDPVKARQPLVALDVRDYQLRLKQAQVGLEGAVIQYDATKVEWERAGKLLADNALPKSQFDMVDAKLKGAAAGVDAARVNVELMRKMLSDAVIRAPYAGIVVKRHVNEGEYAAAMPPMPLVTIEETGTIDLRVQAPAVENGKIGAGDDVIVRFPDEGKELPAKVARIVDVVDPRTRTFSVIVELPNPDGSLRSGMFAEVRRVGGAETRP